MLRKLFVGDFYRQHASTFMFLYVLFMGSFLFINYLGELPTSEIFFWHFVLMIFMVTQQFMVVLFLALSTFYMIKTRLFIKSLLLKQQYAFLNQSLGVLPKSRQWWSWFKVEVWLCLPLLIYGMACLGMSIFKGVAIYGIVIVLFLLMGICIISWLNYRQLMRVPFQRKAQQHLLFRPRINLSRWMVFIYTVTREVPALILTKCATIVFMLLMIHWQREEVMSLRQWWLSFLLVGSAHALLVFRASLFMETSFKDFWGLPLDPLRGFLFASGRCYLLLLLPEFFILLLNGYVYFALIGLVSEWCILFFYHYFAPYLRFNLKALLKTGFLLLCVAFVLTLYGFYWLVVIGYLLIAGLLFGRRYYCLP